MQHSRRTLGPNRRRSPHPRERNQHRQSSRSLRQFPGTATHSNPQQSRRRWLHRRRRSTEACSTLCRRSTSSSPLRRSASSGARLSRWPKSRSHPLHRDVCRHRRSTMCCRCKRRSRRTLQARRSSTLDATPDAPDPILHELSPSAILGRRRESPRVVVPRRRTPRGNSRMRTAVGLILACFVFGSSGCWHAQTGPTLGFSPRQGVAVMGGRRWSGPLERHARS